eukprot:1710513-Rhodomonas_salina.1
MALFWLWRFRIVSDKVRVSNVQMCGSIGYVLAGMILFPSVTKQAQGRVCKEGDWDNRWCEDELVIKDSTAVIAMCGIILTVLIACWLTYLFIREVRNARKASQIILKGCSAPRQPAVLLDFFSTR